MARCLSLAASLPTAARAERYSGRAQVKSIHWTVDDTRLISAGMDGAVYEWQLKDFKRISENVLKACSYTCAVCTADARSIFAVGSDRKMKEISDSNINKDFETGVVINQARTE